jgi:uncharacterized protein (DUF3084 family)
VINIGERVLLESLDRARGDRIAVEAERDLVRAELEAALTHIGELEEQLRVATRIARDAEQALCELRARLS